MVEGYYIVGNNLHTKNLSILKMSDVNSKVLKGETQKF